MAGGNQFALWHNARMPAKHFSPALLRRALVIKLRHHGDVLLAAPVLSACEELLAS